MILRPRYWTIIKGKCKRVQNIKINWKEIFYLQKKIGKKIREDFFTKTLLLFSFCRGGLLHWNETENVAQTIPTFFQNYTEDLENESVGNKYKLFFLILFVNFYVCLCVYINFYNAYM